jgi:SAM-dependent methyltransferase
LTRRTGATKRYAEIVEHYEACFKAHGDSHLGMDWPIAEDAQKRYGVMLDVVRQPSAPNVELLDFGCGTSHLYEHILRQGITGIQYLGLDMSEQFIEVSRRKFPDNRYICADILENPDDIPRCDYVVMNGVFTEKRGLSFDEMLGYFEDALQAVFPKAKMGIAFNVMSKCVDWERDDLFHLPFDALTSFLTRTLSRNFVIRNDYGLYEYTTYLYR